MKSKYREEVELKKNGKRIAKKKFLMVKKCIKREETILGRERV